ncbi:hypothetical protein VZT92_020425 [Zoarces viviparus]|uniref:Secreted protein n=1 Tax=Zoarces viviparus TaxID=48416 RepID=A0AAW1EDS2_ZOAVI
MLTGRRVVLRSNLMVAMLRCSLQLLKDAAGWMEEEEEGGGERLEGGELNEGCGLRWPSACPSDDGFGRLT